MERFRNFIFLGLLAVLFAEVLIIFPLKLGKHQDSQPATEKREAETTGPAEQFINGLHLVESQKGNRDWELFAVRAEGNQQGGGSWSLEEVRVLFYSGDKVEFTVTGKGGSIDGKTKNMKIRGGVKTVSTNGYIFQTEEVEYNALSRKIVSPSHVSVQGPRDQDGEGLRVEGQRMLVEVDESKMSIPEDVRAEKQLRGGRKMNVISQGAEFSGKNKEVKFLGNVVMQYDQVKLEGPVASFLSQQKGDFLSNIRLSGGVKVSDADKFATSENLNLDLIANKFVFTGRPKVYQDNDELSGEQIIFLDGGKKVKVERVNAIMKDKGSK